MLVDKVLGSAPGLAASFTPCASSIDLGRPTSSSLAGFARARRALYRYRNIEEVLILGWRRPTNRCVLALQRSTSGASACASSRSSPCRLAMDAQPPRPACRYRSTSGLTRSSSSSPARSAFRRSTSVADFAHGPRPHSRLPTLDLRLRDRCRPDDRPRARASEQPGASSLPNIRRSRATGSPHRLARRVVAWRELTLPLALLHTGSGVELHTPRRSGRARRLCRHPCLGPSRLSTSTRRAFLHLTPTPPRLAHARASMSPRGARSNSKSGRCVLRPAPPRRARRGSPRPSACSCECGSG